MLQIKNCLPLLHNGVFLQSIIFLVMMLSPSVFGDQNVTCSCVRSEFDLFKKRDDTRFKENDVCRQSTADKVECASGWCFKANIDVQKPGQEGKYQEQGCAPVRTEDSCATDSKNQITLTLCFCHQDMCNYEKPIEKPPVFSSSLPSSPPSSFVLFLGLLLLFFHVK